MTERNADGLVSTAYAEVGYLEKASNSKLDSKTGNAGYNNYTKYWRDLDASMQGNAWCDAFVSWCFAQVFGDEADDVLCGGLHSYYTPTSASKYKSAGRWHTTPKKGDQVFFENSTRICHTGIVRKVTSSKVHTIEGNTSAASGVVANGGAVAAKSYDLGYSRIAGYGRPRYEEVDELSSSQYDKIMTAIGALPSASDIASKVWATTYKSKTMRDRLYLCNKKDYDTADPTGRGKEFDNHDHIKWIAAVQAEQGEKITAIEAKLDEIIAKLG